MAVAVQAVTGQGKADTGRMWHHDHDGTEVHLRAESIPARTRVELGKLCTSEKLPARLARLTAPVVKSDMLSKMAKAQQALCSSVASSNMNLMQGPCQRHVQAAALLASSVQVESIAAPLSVSSSDSCTHDGTKLRSLSLGGY